MRNDEGAFSSGQSAGSATNCSMTCSPRRYGPWAAHPATARTKTMRPSARLIGMTTIDDSSSAASSFFALDRAHMAMYPMPQEVTSSLSGPPGPHHQYSACVTGRPPPELGEETVMAHLTRRSVLRGSMALGATRSEEHTSELQSLAYLVCRLLLEKKKKNTTQLKSSRCSTE